MRETDALFDLYVGGEVIYTTGEHPFWVPDFGWVEAKDLVVGSLLQTGDGRIVDVDKIERKEGKFEVYNFKVEGIPTYFVSELGILVHNAEYSPYVNKSIEELLKSQKSYQQLIEEHQQKLLDYVANPDAYDHQGLLTNAPPGLRQKIINGRVKSLQKQINKQTGELEKINEQLKIRG